MSQSIYETITHTVIQQLEQGTRMWHKPWQTENASVSFGIPVNATTGKAYRGINIPLLWMAADEKGYQTNEYATYKQWAERKEFVKQGEKGNLIVFYDVMEKENDKHQIEKIPFLKVSHVFNKSQLKSYVPSEAVQEQPRPMFERLEQADTFIKNTGASIKHDGRDRAYYNRISDDIHLPVPEAFIGTPTQSAQESYYATSLHELAHLSGHPKRLDRQFGKRFGDQDYAFEELVAEITSAFLCAKLEITDAPRPDHAQYLANWLQVLKNDSKAILTAASQASKACDYLETMREVVKPANDNCLPCVSAGFQMSRRVS